MDKLWIEGIVPAVFTPMQPDGSLNLERIPDIVEHLIGEGVNALYVCGSTGEGPSLTTEERMDVAEAYLRTVAGRLPVIVQVGHDSLKQARGLAEIRLLSLLRVSGCAHGQTALRRSNGQIQTPPLLP